MQWAPARRLVFAVFGSVDNRLAAINSDFGSMNLADDGSTHSFPMLR
jgi:hypothetical protein